MNKGKFINSICGCGFSSTSPHLERRGHLLFTGISFPLLPCKTLDPNY